MNKTLAEQIMALQREQLKTLGQEHAALQKEHAALQEEIVPLREMAAEKAFWDEYDKTYRSV